MTIENETVSLKPYVVSPAAGKRLIARAAVRHPSIRRAMHERTLVIVAGTTNGYVVEEILGELGEAEAFGRRRFFRGVTLPPHCRTTEAGRLPDESAFPGDVVITRGSWLRGKTIFDVVHDLREGDVILKGANAVDLVEKRAAVLIGHPRAGTIGVALQAVLGRRVELILPVGLEKRVVGSLDGLAAMLNAVGAQGPRLLPVPGAIFTELEAIQLVTGAVARLVAGGGVGGAEGSVWLAVRGTAAELEEVDRLMESVVSEPNFEL